MGNKYKTKKGDSWIKIANNNNISLDDLLYYNGIDPTSSEQLPVLTENQKIYIKDPYRLNASVVTADSPKEYGKFGSSGQKKIEQYALAVKSGKMDINQVPKRFQTAVYQRMIAQGNNKFANHAFNVGSNITMFLMNPAAYIAGTAAQKGTAYTVDKISGRNEYGIGNVLGNTPVMGREYQAEKPGVSAAVDIATGIFGGGLLRNLKNIANPSWRQAFSQAVKSNVQNTTGLSDEIVHTIPASQFSKGHVYQYRIKGFGKSGNKVSGSPSGGYRPVTSAKSTFNHSAGINVRPIGNQNLVYASNYQMPNISIPGAYPGVIVPAQLDPEVEVVTPERHIYEQQSFNRWQMPNLTGEIAPHRPGTGRFSITGEAPIGITIDDQALTNESINTYYDYLPRKAVYIPESISGTPSNIHSGLGITYGSENPGNLIIK